MYQEQRTKPQGFFQRDSVLLGFLAGVFVPFVGLAVLMMLVEQFSTITFREKTMYLLALCMNLIPFTIFQKRRMDASMRGVFLPTIFYIMIWVYLYSDQLFG